MSTRARPEAPDQRALERSWRIRTIAVLQAPRQTFLALRDDSDDAAEARQEPLLLVLWLAGIAGVLSTGAAGRLYDDYEISGLVVAVWAFIAGGIYGAFVYFVLGLLLHLGTDLAGSVRGTFRRARHLVGLAAVPLALSLLVFLVRLAIYGGDLFRTGGSDRGTGDAVFNALELAFLGWALGLVVLGTRLVEDWPWRKALAAAAVPTIVPVLALLRAHGAI